MNIKIFGIERSGTNYLEEILKLNTDYRVYVNKYGWKHGRVELNRKDCSDEDVETEMDYICIVKNPYSWYLSIMKWSKKEGAEYWLNKYKELYEHYLDKIEVIGEFYKKGRLIKYEDLLKDPIETLSEVGIDLFSDIKIPEKVYMSPNFKKEKVNKYIAEDFPLPDETIKLINDIIPEELFKKLKYERRMYDSRLATT
jgi:hypothetical protein